MLTGGAPAPPRSFGIRPMQKIWATVIVDASFCQFEKVAGWAGWVRIDGRDEAVKYSGPLTECTDSTLAEVKAAANGVWLASKAGASHILLQSDCMAVLHVLRGKSRAERLVGVWEELRAMPEVEGRYLYGKHVKGHGPIVSVRTYCNDWCDRMARAEMRKLRQKVSRYGSK